MIAPWGHSSTYTSVAKFYATRAFPGAVGTTISPYVAVIGTIAQAVTTTLVGITSIEGAAHAGFVDRITRLIDRRISSGEAIWIVTVCKCLD